MKHTLSYLITIQFLGFRFHGWQKQSKVKTVHEMIDKTLFFVFDHKDFKTLGMGRTDAKVSASEYVIQLFVSSALEPNFKTEFQSNLPPDIKILGLREVPCEFNLIKHPKIKTYGYFFSFGTKNHPFSSPFIVGIEDALNIDLMRQGARLFEGFHWFHKYCTKPSEKTVFYRQIISCEIVENTLLTANFFPKKSYVLRVLGQGFLRYQIRLMMGVLFKVGKGELDLAFISDSLKENNDRAPLTTIAQSSGLQLLCVNLIE